MITQLIRGRVVLNGWFGWLADWEAEHRERMYAGVHIHPDDAILATAVRKGVLAPATWAVSADPADIRSSDVREEIAIRLGVRNVRYRARLILRSLKTRTE